MARTRGAGGWLGRVVLLCAHGRALFGASMGLLAPYALSTRRGRVGAIWYRHAAGQAGMPAGGLPTSSGASTIHRACPIAVWALMWQWNSQTPGFEASKRRAVQPDVRLAVNWGSNCGGQQ